MSQPSHPFDVGATVVCFGRYSGTIVEVTPLDGRVLFDARVPTGGGDTVREMWVQWKDMKAPA